MIMYLLSYTLLLPTQLSKSNILIMVLSPDHSNIDTDYVEYKVPMTGTVIILVTAE